MQMATALVFRMKCGSEGAMLLTKNMLCPRSSEAAVGFEPVVRRKNLRFVDFAVSNRDAQHASRCQRDQSLHGEQEYGDEFDESNGHLVVVCRSESVYRLSSV